MTVRKIPSAPSEKLVAYVGKLPAKAMDRWDSALKAGYLDDSRTIHVYGLIGEVWDIVDDGEGLDFAMVGTTSQQINTFLQKLGPGPVTININSPGGDMFEGLAIYNLLREHNGEVTVNVIGVAASAASVIAMAGDRINIAKAGFYMIHNTWMTYSGNRNDFIAMAEQMLPFDKAMAGIYSDRTGIPEAEVLAFMDAETWISGSEAVDKGFADAVVADGAAAKPQASARKPASPRQGPEAEQHVLEAMQALSAACAATALLARLH